MRLLLIDHEDSFTYNLAHLLSSFGKLDVKNYYDLKEKHLHLLTKGKDMDLRIIELLKHSRIKISVKNKENKTPL